MTEEKVFIKDDKAKFICPKCKKVTIEDVSQFRDIEVVVRIKHGCTCGHSYNVLLERRKFYRKNVNLTGTFCYMNDRNKIAMLIKDVSRGGLKMIVSHPGNFKEGDKLFVEFHLDDKHKTLIQKEVIIRNRYNNRTIGVEFTSRDMKNPYDKAYDIALGFYTYK